MEKYQYCGYRDKLNRYLKLKETKLELGQLNRFCWKGPDQENGGALSKACR